MRKMTLKRFIKEYLRINGTITFEDANRLYGCTYGGFTGRIKEIRDEGWDISQASGEYQFNGEPEHNDKVDDPRPVILSIDEAAEILSILGALSDLIESKLRID